MISSLTIKIHQNKLAVCKIIHTCLGWKQAVVLKDRYKEIQPDQVQPDTRPISRPCDGPDGALITILRKHKN